MIGTLAAAVCVAALLALGIWVHIENQRYGRLIETVVGQQAAIRTALRGVGIAVGEEDADVPGGRHAAKPAQRPSAVPKGTGTPTKRPEAVTDRLRAITGTTEGAA